MAGWDGSGNFSRNYDWTDERDAGNNIDSTKFDAENETFRLGIESCIAKSGENAATADLQMGGFKHVGVADGTALTNYASVNQVQNGTLLYGGISSGSANAQTITLTPAPTAIENGQMLRFVAGYTNTGACTMNVNNLGAEAIYSSDGMTLSGGEIVVDRSYVVMYGRGIGPPWTLVTEAPREVAFRAERITNAQTINNITATSVLYNSEVYDYGSDYVNSTFTAPFDGVYNFSASVTTNGASGPFILKILTSTGTQVGTLTASYTSIGGGGTVSGDVELSASDTVFVQFYQESGGQVATAYGGGETNFCGHLVFRT